MRAQGSPSPCAFPLPICFHLRLFRLTFAPLRFCVTFLFVRIRVHSRSYYVKRFIAESKTPVALQLAPTKVHGKPIAVVGTGRSRARGRLVPAVVLLLSSGY
jgi:hypothetical protein